MKYSARPPRRRWPKRLAIIAVAGIVLIAAATFGVRYAYNRNLAPLSSTNVTSMITVKEGASAEAIAKQLEDAKIIRSAWAFKLYVSSKDARGVLKAGSYELSPSQSVAEIVSQLTHGEVATNLVTILPGQRIDQIRTRLLQEGFNESDVNAALNPDTYAGHPALVDKPVGASLEGYIYPESYQRDSSTTAQQIIARSLDEMNKRLSTYQAITLASIVEKEVAKQEDRDQVAQVFLKRLRAGMRLESDATASYGAILAGQKPSSHYDSAYNTYNNSGLPPTPIINVTQSSLKAAANPAATDWLYFVSGDDGTTHFSRTLAEQEANIQRYCTRLCSQ
jgi:UPF0755 protein